MPASIRMVSFFSPWKRRTQPDSNSVPSAAGVTPRAICEILRDAPASRSLALWPQRHAMRPASPSPALPSPWHADRQHLFGSPGVLTPSTEAWDSRNMVALDNQAFFGSRVPRFKLTLGPLVGGIALGSLLLVVGAILVRGFAENGFRLGSQLGWRYASFIFFLALVAGPLCRTAARFFPGLPVPESLSRKLVWGFCLSYGIYLLSVFVPNVIRPSAGAALMVLFGGAVVLVMAVTAAPLARLGRAPIIANNIRR